MLKNESTEMYLETLLRLSERSKAIREVDLAEAMRISKVSVCKAVKRLVEKIGSLSLCAQAGKSLTTFINFAIIYA